MKTIKTDKQEIPQIELLTPLTGEFYPDYEENDMEYYGEDLSQPELLDGADLVQYQDVIQDMVDLENSGETDGAPSNLMDYFYGSESVREKVKSAIVSVKSIEGTLYGCTTLTLQEFLEAPELTELCEYITGQYSDGWGEGFEQRDLKVDGGTLNVHFYQKEKFRIQEKVDTPAETDHHVPKERPKLKLLGHDGNIYSILADARRLLHKCGRGMDAEEMIKRVEASGNYYKALSIVSEYVETELSIPKEKTESKKKPERGDGCR